VKGRASLSHASPLFKPGQLVTTRGRTLSLWHGIVGQASVLKTEAETRKKKKKEEEKKPMAITGLSARSQAMQCACDATWANTTRTTANNNNNNNNNNSSNNKNQYIEFRGCACFTTNIKIIIIVIAVSNTNIDHVTL
jgi:hypothetical protein